jgi:hypothetical protein
VWQAIKGEWASVLHHEVPDLMSQTENKGAASNPISCRLVLVIKIRLSDGKVMRCKARLVAQGFAEAGPRAQLQHFRQAVPEGVEPFWSHAGSPPRRQAAQQDEMQMKLNPKIEVSQLNPKIEVTQLHARPKTDVARMKVIS